MATTRSAHCSSTTAGTWFLEAENTVRTDKDVAAHAETNLLRMTSARFESIFLERCTL